MRTVLVLVLFFFFSFFGLSQQIEKIDVNPVDPYDISYPRWFTKTGNAVLFSSLTCEFGDEPWRFDGSTSKVLDIIPGEVGSEPVNFNLVNGKIYFRAKINGSSLFGLYLYDQLLDSAVLVSPPGWTNPSDFVEFNSKLYCVLSHPSIGNELWEIDGYSNYQVTNNLESFVIMDLSAASNGIYFCGSDAMGYEPWFYDGFSAVMLADINAGPNSSWPSDFVVVNDTLFFLADDGLHFEELWLYDGMNASLVQDINPLASSMIENIFTDGSSLFFRAYDPLIGNELRVLENGILLSFDNYPGIGSATPTNYVSYNGSVLFMMNDGTTGNEMWKYENGVVSLFSDINPGSAGSNFNSDGTALVIGGDLYFTALQAGFGYGLYRTDGASVTMEPDFNGIYNVGNMRHNGNEFLFSGGTVSGINELWKYDGVTYTMIQVNFSGTGSSASYLTLLDDTLYFGATDGVNGIEPYAYDGTSVISLGNTNEFSVGADIGRLDTLNGSIYFLADISPYGEDFWLYDGVNASIVVDTNIVFSIDAFFNYDGLLNNEIIFSASQIGSGYELWGFDGASIYQILDISAGPSNGFPDDFIQFGEDVFFSAQDGMHGNELWTYDGSAASLAVDIHPTGSSFPIPQRVFNNELYLNASDGISGKELWRYDGVSISLVADINPGIAASYPEVKCEYDGKLIFVANDGVLGRELYSWDGSAVVLLADINPGANYSNPEYFLEYDGILYFQAENAALGKELWSYSSLNGVQLVADINPGSGPSNVFELIIFDNKLHFCANDGTGAKLMQYDGMTLSICGGGGIMPVSYSLAPSFTIYNDDLYLVDNNGSDHVMWRYNGYNFNIVEYQNAPGATYTYPLAVYDNVLYGRADFDCDDWELWKLNAPGCSETLSNYSEIVCEEYDFGGSILTSSGQYYLTYPNSLGCDSIIELNLTVFDASFATTFEIACETYDHYGNALTVSGTYEQIFTNQFGCDSIETLQLIIYQPSDTTVFLEGCDSVAFEGSMFYSSGIFPLNMIGMGGCDSVIFVDATIHSSNPYIEQQSENLNAVPGIIGLYQWLDCDNSMAALVGETDDVYTPTQDGSFAVVVDLDGCVDTSSCFTFIIDNSGIEELILHSYVHPNPFSNSIEVNTKFSGSKYIVIYDQFGAVIYKTVMLEESFSLPTADYASGVYTIVIRTDENLEIFKLLKL